MTPRLSGHFPIFGLVFLLNSLLKIARQRSREQIAILTPTSKRRSHVRILIYQTWSIVYIIYGQWILADSFPHPVSKLALCHQHGLVPRLSTSVPLTAKIIKTHVRHLSIWLKFGNEMKKMINYVYCNASRISIVKMIEFMFFPIRQDMLTNPKKFGRFCINLCWNFKGRF